MTPSQITTLLTSTLPKQFPVLLTGAPGVGKTSLVAAAADALGMDIVVCHPAVSDPTDAKGLPWFVPGEDSARFVPYGELAEVLSSKTPTVWFWDDLGQASPAVQASYMPWLLARACGSHRLPDHVTIVAATNGREHRAGVSGLLAPVKSRFATIVSVEPTLNDWVDWALTRGLAPEIIAYLRSYPQHLIANEVAPGLQNEPNPRTWENAARIFSLDLPKALRLPALAGAIGEGAAVEFCAYLEMLSSLVSVDAILTDPTHAPLPEGPSQYYATVTGLAARTDQANFRRCALYIDRIVDAGFAEFAVLYVKDSLRRQGPKLTTNADYIRLMTGPLGKLITGDATITGKLVTA